MKSELQKLHLDYEDCLQFFKTHLKITLFPYQEKMLKAFLEGKRVWSPRACGRTMILNGIKHYTAREYPAVEVDKLDRIWNHLSLLNDVSYIEMPTKENYDLIIDFHDVVNAGLISEKTIEQIRLKDLERFKREFVDGDWSEL